MLLAEAGGWRESEDDKVYTPEQLLECYYTSVGRNTNLLLGMAINQDGYFADEEQFIEFGKLVKDIYVNPVKSTKGIGDEFTLALDEPAMIKHIVVMEDIHYGEKVRDFSVYVEDESGEEEVFHARCIGHKRIVKLDRKIKRATLKINECTDTVIIKDFTLYG